jgi:hypothetical protein
MSNDGRDHLLALADADPDADADDDRCGAYGPGGECARTRGHYEDDDGTPQLAGVLFHYSWDTGHYKQWPVGWKSSRDCINLIHAPEFAAALTGNDDYRRGVEDTLRLVRATLINPR